MIDLHCQNTEDNHSDMFYDKIILQDLRKTLKWMKTTRVNIFWEKCIENTQEKKEGYVSLKLRELESTDVDDVHD